MTLSNDAVARKLGWFQKAGKKIGGKPRYYINGYLVTPTKTTTNRDAKTKWIVKYAEGLRGRLDHGTITFWIEENEE
jgi:hypothetical protein